MGQLRMIGLALIIVGIVAFFYEGVVSYQTREKVIDVGSVEVFADKTKHVALGPATGAIALAGGVILLVASVKRP